MARISTFRAAAGSFEVNWTEAGLKTYSGLALIRTMSNGKDLAMFRLGDRATPAEYRSLAEACTELAALALQAAEVAAQGTAPAKLDKAQVERIRDGLKNVKPADRLTARANLAMAGVVIALADFGYSDDTGKPIADKAPTPPTPDTRNPTPAQPVAA